MYKYVPLPEKSVGPGGQVEDTVQVLFGARYVSDRQLEKRAYARKTHEDILRFMANHTKDPDCIYVQVNAMGAGDAYGPNVNADYFAEKDLAPRTAGASYGYKTFLDAGVYRNHNNKDRTKSFGKVVLAIYNNEMRRVELIIAVSREKACRFGHSDLIQRLDRGEAVPVSMGCRVAFDVCRIRGCGNKARTKIEYCEHMLRYKGQVLEDGQQVCVDNPLPVFFDISFVVVNADKIGFTVMKFASAQDEVQDVLSNLDHEHTYLDPSIFDADSLVKRIPAMSVRLAPVFEGCTPPLHWGSLHRMFQGRDFKRTLGSLADAGVVLTPKEFGAGALVSAGRGHAALDFLQDPRPLPRPTGVTIISIRTKGAPLGLSGLESRTLRGSMPMGALPKIQGGALGLGAGGAEERQAGGLAQKIANSYAGYRGAVLEKSGSFISPAALKAGALEVGDALRSYATSPGKNFALALPLAYLYSAYLGRQPEDNKNFVERFAQEHPILSAAAAAGMARLLQAAGTKVP